MFLSKLTGTQIGFTTLGLLTITKEFLLTVCLWYSKPVLSGHSKVNKRKILMTNCSFKQVESIAECSPWSILQYF